MNSHLGLCVLQISDQKQVVHNVDVFQFVSALLDHRFPVRFLWVLCINRDQLPTRSVPISANPKHRPVIVDEAILRVEVIEQFHDFRIRFSQIFVVKAVFR